MRQYDLYRIEEEVASYYYGREQKFYGLFREYSMSEGEFKEIVEGQIQYITKKIPILPMHQLLKEGLKRKDPLQNEGNIYWVHKDGKEKEFARMELAEHKISIWAEGDQDVESIFFDLLRKMDNFLAIDLENERYGWLKPWRERKYI
ncbi:sporulation inhibitor of replication protein SirA [Bacillus carboniphilus]|uniref:Sporulation inhibitor of replication protein SirA n=1 Tax=Bacillus carboniphilus TaxID=86663 RepID=A0ABN0WJ56_9BACI